MVTTVLEVRRAVGLKGVQGPISLDWLQTQLIHWNVSSWRAGDFGCLVNAVQHRQKSGIESELNKYLLNLLNNYNFNVNFACSLEVKLKTKKG